jgi:hypothetical protein
LLAVVPFSDQIKEMLAAPGTNPPFNNILQSSRMMPLADIHVKLAFCIFKINIL